MSVETHIPYLLFQVTGKNHYLIDNQRMFNVGTDDFENVLRDDIGIVIFDLRGHGGCKRPKTPLRGQKRHEKVDSLKKVFNKSFSTTSKTPKWIQSDWSYNLRVESYDF